MVLVRSKSKKLGDRLGSILAVLGLFESLGPIIARVYIPIGAAFYRGVSVICWNKMKPWIEAQRAQGWTNPIEWLQWLTDRMDERLALSSEIPAFEQFAAWEMRRGL